MDKKFKQSNSQVEKNVFRDRIFNFLDKLNNQFGEKINEEIKPVKPKKEYKPKNTEAIKEYKHEYYLRNKEKYRLRNKVNNKLYREKKKNNN